MRSCLHRANIRRVIHLDTEQTKHLDRVHPVGWQWSSSMRNLETGITFVVVIQHCSSGYKYIKVYILRV